MLLNTGKQKSETNKLLFTVHFMEIMAGGLGLLIFRPLTKQEGYEMSSDGWMKNIYSKKDKLSQFRLLKKSQGAEWRPDQKDSDSFTRLRKL